MVCTFLSTGSGSCLAQVSGSWGHESIQGASAEVRLCHPCLLLGSLSWLLASAAWNPAGHLPTGTSVLRYGPALCGLAGAPGQLPSPRGCVPVSHKLVVAGGGCLNFRLAKCSEIQS